MRQHPRGETLSQSPVEAPSPTSAPSMTSTLALLPSSPISSPYGNPFAASLPLSQQYSPNNDSADRPKLTLNTALCSRRRLGKGNTGLRFDKLSANSPTAQNTFRNGYDQHHHPPTPASLHDPSSGSSTGRSSAASSSAAPSTPHPCFASPHSSTTSVSERSPSSSRPSSSDSKPSTPPLTSTKAVPYTRTPFLHSILSNTPLTGAAVGRISPRRKPSRRGVAFRSALTEDIETTMYTARHSDLFEGKEGVEARTPGLEENMRSEKPESSSEEEPSETDSGEDTDASTESCPKTPVAGRRKRRRDWKWTLGPLEGVECRTPDTPDPEPDISRPDRAVPAPTSAPKIAVPVPRKRIAK